MCGRKGNGGGGGKFGEAEPINCKVVTAGGKDTHVCLYIVTGKENEALECRGG